MWDTRGTEAANPGYPRLLGDIGGTNARLGWQAEAGAPITHVQVLGCAQYQSLSQAIAHYLQKNQLPQAAWAALGMSNPVVDDWVSMTNHHWQFSVEALRQQLGLERLLVLNDFTALALALPHLPAHELYALGEGTVAPGAPIALIGPGTGMGVSGLLPKGGSGQWVPIAGEGGHVTLAAQNALRPLHN